MTHKENWHIDRRAKGFGRWLKKRFYDVTGELMNAGVFADVCGMLEGKAYFDGPEYFLYRRVANVDGKVYVDLGDPLWRYVEVTVDGWRLEVDPPVKFRRAKAMTAFPDPCQTSRSLKELLLPFLNIKEQQWPLAAAWLAAAIQGRGPYPILKFLGEQGSAKTTTARVFRALADPNTAPVRAEPKSTRDLMITANHNHVICLDNLSSMKPELSDALCRLSTGGGFATRTLYTDEDETIFEAMRPVILTSIEEVATRSDLLERSLILELPTIDEDNRRAEKAFWREFAEVHGEMFGALLNVVCGGLKQLPRVEARDIPDLPRMADFYTWGIACEKALGLEDGEFAEAYQANREAATEIVLSSNPAIETLLNFLRTDPGAKGKLENYTATELLDLLRRGVDPSTQKSPGWPKTARGLSSILSRSAPNLREIGVVARKGYRGSGDAKEKVWNIDSALYSGSQNRTGRKNADEVLPGSESGLQRKLRKRRKADAT